MKAFKQWGQILSLIQGYLLDVDGVAQALLKREFGPKTSVLWTESKNQLKALNHQIYTANLRPTIASGKLFIYDSAMEP